MHLILAYRTSLADCYLLGFECPALFCRQILYFIICLMHVVFFAVLVLVVGQSTFK